MGQCRLLHHQFAGQAVKVRRHDALGLLLLDPQQGGGQLRPLVPKICYADGPEICPVRAWTACRTRPVTEHCPRWADPSTPAFVGLDR